MPPAPGPDNTARIPLISQDDSSIPGIEYFFHLLHQAARQRDRRCGEAMAESGLSTGRWRTLAVIRRIENCTMTDLARHTGADRTTLTRAVDQLVAQGLVERWVPPRDRRKISLVLTPAGESACDSAERVLMAENAALLQRLDPKTVRDGTRLLRKVLGALVENPVEARELVAFGRPAEDAAPGAAASPAEAID